MSKNSILLTIGIPAYGRPQGLDELLNSIDITSSQLEILIIEDFSPFRKEISSIVSTFAQKSSLNIRYLENKVNLGFDLNIQNIIKHSLVNMYASWGMMMHLFPGCYLSILVSFNPLTKM